MIRLFRKQLFEAFFDWLEINKDTLKERYAWLYNKGRGAEADCDTAIKIMADSMWILNMIADCGVLAGLGTNSVSLQGLAKGLDQKSTLRLLHLMSACMNLQYLPKEEIKRQIPIISSKKFSLKLYSSEE